MRTCKTCGQRVRYIGSHAMREHAEYGAEAQTLQAAIVAAKLGAERLPEWRRRALAAALPIVDHTAELKAGGGYDA